jgi:hypothetical protein
MANFFGISKDTNRFGISKGTNECMKELIDNFVEPPPFVPSEAPHDSTFWQRLTAWLPVELS